MRLKRWFLSHRVGKKILLYSLTFLIFLFFSNDFGLVDIQKTAIILAAGIDRTGDEFTVTAEIAVPQSSKDGGQTQEVSVSGKGKTVAEAVRQINVKTGWFPKFVFCDLIVLGEGALQDSVFDALRYFIRHEYTSDNVLVAACAGTASDLLSSPLPTEQLTAMSVQKILSSQAQKEGNVAAVNLKDFANMFYSEHKSGYLPYLVKTPAKQKSGEENEKNGDGTGENIDEGKESGGKESAESKEKSGKGEETVVLDASQIALFYDGKMTGLLTKEQSFAFNLFFNPVRETTLQVPFDDKTYGLELKDFSRKADFRIEDNAPVLRLRLSAGALLADCSSCENLMELTNYLQVKPEVEAAGENLLKTNVAGAFGSAKAANCDLFDLLTRLKRFAPADYPAFKDDLLNRVQLKISVEIRDFYLS